jgi:predicted dehydrogenase
VALNRALDSKHRLGVVGAGVFGRYHALKAQAGPRTACAGVFDPDFPRAQATLLEQRQQKP